MYESRRFAHRKRFRFQVDPVVLLILAGGVLLGCGILIGHAATARVDPSAACLATTLFRL